MKVYRDLESLISFKNAIVTIGSYDGLHTGHRAILKHLIELAQIHDGESVVITFHPHPRQVVYPNDKTLRLLNTLEEKIKLFKETGIDHLVIAPFSVEFSQIHPREYVERFLLKYFDPFRIVIGYDHKFGLNREGDISLLQSYENDKLKIIEIEKQRIDNLTISSTKIRNAITSGFIDEANLLLGHPYTLIGEVVHGQKLGHTIGYPTANLKALHPSKLIPSEGIYAVRVEIDEVFHDGMLYIGNKPTIEGEHKQVIEVNIFDFNQNIYGQQVCVYFIDYVREDKKFSNLDELKVALAEDKEKVKQIFNAYHYSQSTPKATIAILNYNGVTHLEAYLPSLINSSEHKTDIMLIDNKSTDDSIAFVEEWNPEVQIIKLNQNHGFAGGYNEAFKHIETEYTAILNSDVEVTEGWLDPMLSMMEDDGSIACVQPKIKAIESKSSFEYAGAAGGFLDKLGYPFCRGRMFDTVEEDKGQYDTELEIFWASGAAMLVRTKLFKKLGGFDKDFFAHMEEIDFCWRAKRAGYKIMYTPKSTVYHLGGGTLNYDSPHKVFLNFRNNLFLLLKNEKKSSLFWKFPLRLILDGIAGIKFFLSGKWNACFAIIKAHFAVYGNFYSILEKRKALKRQISDLAIGRENNIGRKNFLIIFKYFIQGKKHFEQIEETAN